MSRLKNVAGILTVLFVSGSLAKAETAAPVRRVFGSDQKWLKLEWLSDGVLHFEYKRGQAPSDKEPITRSLLTNAGSFDGPKGWRDDGGVFVTNEMRTEVNGTCFTINDFQSKQSIGPVCADKMDQAWKSLTVAASGVKNVYGLGQIFETPGSYESDLHGRVVQTKAEFGNGMPSYAGGATGEALFPVAFAMGSGSKTWALVLDNIYKQSWDVRGSQWSISQFGDELRGYIISADTPVGVRSRFMALVGKAPLPPRKIFGFWMSEYGYENWQQIDDRLEGMRKDHFPIDGFYLDLQWFGGVTSGSDYTSMGRLKFDENNFPSPAEHIRSYAEQGIGLIPIEESYIGKSLSEYDDLGRRGYLAHRCGAPSEPSYLTGNVTGNTSEWWGRGGMMDWSNREGAAYWHDIKRQKLVDLGIAGHWLDLGEPEMFDRSSCYSGGDGKGEAYHQDVHNIFSVLWVKSIWEGYARNHVTRRSYSMLRSGNLGLQRYGAGMWSGDIGGNLESLKAHVASHNQMSWSGIDYYSSDIGGFHRNRQDGQALDERQTQENFTQWFANGTWFDVPVRSHVMNLDHAKITAPNRIGHIESNRANLVERYSLIPYYYSLAAKAAREGTPLMMPMAMAFPEDLRLRARGDERMIGDLLVRAAADSAASYVDVTLPRGLWYDIRDESALYANGYDDLRGVPLYRNGLYMLPVYAQAGGIITRGVEAKMEIDVYVNPESTKSEFVLHEDDGITRDGDARLTTVGQRTSDNTTTIDIGSAAGTFSGALSTRSWTVRAHAPSSFSVWRVMVGGSDVSLCGTVEVNGSPCYKIERRAGGAFVAINVPDEDVRQSKHIEIKWQPGADLRSSIHFVCNDNAGAERHASMFVVGNIKELGSWNPEHAVPMETNNFLRGAWTKMIYGLPSGGSLEWKCLRRMPQAGTQGVEWQPGPNNHLDLPGESGFAGLAHGAFFVDQKIGRTELYRMQRP